jgi:hypothetical protein
VNVTFGDVVAISSDGAYFAGDVLTFRVRFDKSVVATDGVKLALDTGYASKCLFCCRCRCRLYCFLLYQRGVGGGVIELKPYKLNIKPNPFLFLFLCATKALGMRCWRVGQEAKH